MDRKLMQELVSYFNQLTGYDHELILDNRTPELPIMDPMDPEYERTVETHNGLQLAFTNSFVTEMTQMLAQGTRYKIIGKTFSGVEKHVASRVMSFVSKVLLAGTSPDTIIGLRFGLKYFRGYVRVIGFAPTPKYLKNSELASNQIAANTMHYYDLDLLVSEIDAFLYSLSDSQAVVQLHSNINALSVPALRAIVIHEVPAICAVIMAHLPKSKKRLLLKALPEGMVECMKDELKLSGILSPAPMIVRAILGETMPLMDVKLRISLSVA